MFTPVPSLIVLVEAATAVKAIRGSTKCTPQTFVCNKRKTFYECQVPLQNVNKRTQVSLRSLGSPILEQSSLIIHESASTNHNSV